MNFLENSKKNKNYDVFAEDIRLALNEISKIYGNIDIEDIMDSIISIESRIPILKSKMDVYGSLVKQYEVQLSDLPSKVLEFTRLERDQNIKAETVKFMSQKLEETKINEASRRMEKPWICF